MTHSTPMTWLHIIEDTRTGRELSCNINKRPQAQWTCHGLDAMVRSLSLLPCFNTLSILGNSSKKDQFDLILTGLDNVSFSAKFDLMTCLKSAHVGVYISHNTNANVKEESIVKCAAWGKDIWNK